MLKRLFLIITCLFLLIPGNKAIAITDKQPIDVQEVYTSSETIEGENFMYPKGKAEMRLIRVEVDKGATIPMHSHQIPLMGHIERGELTLKKVSGLSETFKEGDSFVLSSNTPPHTIGNTVNIPAVMWVAVASAEGIPTLTPAE